MNGVSFQKKDIESTSEKKEVEFEPPPPWCPLRDAASQRIPKLTVKVNKFEFKIFC